MSKQRIEISVSVERDTQSISDKELKSRLFNRIEEVIITSGKQTRIKYHTIDIIEDE